MHLHGFADVRTFRVALPRAPFRGRDEMQACEESDLQDESAGWLGIDDLTEFFRPNFSAKNPLNLPGPFYGAETDTCCTGPQNAPDNVLLDRNGQEFVFKQASTASEFRDIVCAAICECFVGYGADGDAHWRLSTIRDWWRTRDDMLAQDIHEASCRQQSILQWRRALQGEAEGYLRVYAFFVENGRVPHDDDSLPQIG